MKIAAIYIFLLLVCLSACSHAEKGKKPAFNLEKDQMINMVLNTRLDSFSKEVYHNGSTVYYELYFNPLKIQVVKEAPVPFKEQGGITYFAIDYFGKGIPISGSFEDDKLSPETYKRIQRLCDTLPTTYERK
jgi:hypothetical protein